MKIPEICVTASAYLMAAVMILLLPLNWLLSAVFAAAVHEFGHLAALKLCSVKIFKIQIGATGARITAAPMAAKQELICAAAGPFCSLSLLCFAGIAPLTALIGLCQGLFNLLPLYPLDGGRILRAGMEILREMTTRRKIPCKEGRLRVQ